MLGRPAQAQAQPASAPTIPCTDVMLQNADNALGQASVELFKFCGDASGGVDIHRSVSDDSGREIQCGRELKRLQEWNQKVTLMKQSGQCPADCFSCAILNPDTADSLDAYLAGVAREDEAAQACTAEEKALTEPKQCVMAMVESLTPLGLLQGKSNCMVEAINGVIQDLFSNVEAIWDLGKMAYHGAKGYIVDSWNSWWSGNDKVADANQAAASQKNSVLQEISSCPTCFIKKVAVGMGEMINEAVKKNFGCEQWDSGVAHVGNCIKPMRNWECASCGQKTNAICGVAGFIAGEVVTSFVLTGGVGFAAKALVKTGGKVAEVVGANLVKNFPKASEVARGATQAAGQGLSHGFSLSREALALRWGSFMKTPLGTSLRYTSIDVRVGLAMSADSLKSVPGLVKTAQVLGYPVRGYLNLMERAGACGWEQGARLGDKVGERAVKFVDELGRPPPRPLPRAQHESPP
jgi:hypothetical protein